MTKPRQNRRVGAADIAGAAGVTTKRTVFTSRLGRTAANSIPLSPMTFLPRTASIHPERTAIIYGERCVSYGEFRARAHRLASALAARGVGEGDTVSVVLPNVPAMLEVHEAVPRLGAVLNAINTRLTAELADHTATAAAAPDLYAVVIRGAGRASVCKAASFLTPPLRQVRLRHDGVPAVDALGLVADHLHGGLAVDTDPSQVADGGAAEVVHQPIAARQAVFHERRSFRIGRPCHGKTAGHSAPRERSHSAAHRR